jgi:hypothetical protein
LIISQPYDYIPPEKLTHKNYAIAHTFWEKDEQFKDAIKKLDAQIIKIKNKQHNQFHLCRNCILRKFPEVHGYLIDLIKNGSNYDITEIKKKINKKE